MILNILMWFCRCAPGCPIAHVKDGTCQKRCNTAGCNFDGGDCSSVRNSEVVTTPLHQDSWMNYIGATNGILSASYGMKKRWYPHHIPYTFDKSVMKG